MLTICSMKRRLRLFTSFVLSAILIFGLVARSAQQNESRRTLSDCEIVDLTHALASKIPVYPGGEVFELSNLSRFNQGFYANKFCCGEHVGTHVDAPSHFSENGKNVDALAPDSLIGPLVILDLRELAAVDPDLLVNLDHVATFEARNGRIPRGAFVVARTGWAEKWDSPVAYLGKRTDGSIHFPGFAPAVARMLVFERNVRGLGIDTLSIDRGTSTDFEAHKILLAAGRIALENVANLGQLPPVGSELVVAPLKIAHGSGAPARLFAFVPRGGRRK